MNCYLIDKNYSENFRKNSHKNNTYLQFWLFVLLKSIHNYKINCSFRLKNILKFFTSLRLKCVSRHIPKSSTWPSFNLKFTFCLYQIESLYENLWKFLNTKIDGTIDEYNMRRNNSRTQRSRDGRNHRI